VPVDLESAVTNPPPVRNVVKPALVVVDEPARDGDEWDPETPLKAPTAAELRNLLGAPDPTRQQSIEEIERLHLAAQDDDTPEPFLVPRRAASPATTEVDPDDIEAAIEIAPPARRPAAAIGKKKPE
jgi:hypothetical protein